MSHLILHYEKRLHLEYLEILFQGFWHIQLKRKEIVNYGVKLLIVLNNDYQTSLIIQEFEIAAHYHQTWELRCKTYWIRTLIKCYFVIQDDRGVWSAHYNYRFVDYWSSISKSWLRNFGISNCNFVRYFVAGKKVQLHELTATRQFLMSMASARWLKNIWVCTINCCRNNHTYMK